MPGVALGDLLCLDGFHSRCFCLSERSDVGNGNHACEGIFLMRSEGVVLGVGKKREGNVTLSSDISKFRTISVPHHWL